MTHEITVKEMAELEGRDITLVVRGLRSVRRAPEDVKIGSYERMTDAEARAVSTYLDGLERRPMEDLRSQGLWSVAQIAELALGDKAANGQVSKAIRRLNLVAARGGRNRRYFDLTQVATILTELITPKTVEDFRVFLQKEETSEAPAAVIRHPRNESLVLIRLAEGFTSDDEALDAIVEQYAKKYWHILRGAK